MKILNNIKTVCAILLLSSLFWGCNDWLDVSPRQEMKESAVYTTEDGFKSVMNGVYIRLASASLYGHNTSMRFPEFLARNWGLPSSSSSTSADIADYNTGQFNYTNSNVESLVGTIWNSYYSTLAHINNLLYALENESATVQFSFNNDKLMKGEALGLRAFLHFELLRYFGQEPIDADPGAKAIPYVTEMTNDPNLLISLTWNEVVSKIEADLNAAEEVLKEVDPIITNKTLFLRNPSRFNNASDSDKKLYADVFPEDNWQHYRQTRFNYYAVLGTKARFYQWLGNKTSAAEYAKMVVEAKDLDAKEKFLLTTDRDYSGDPFLQIDALVFSTEHLFAVQNPSLQTNLNSYFSSSSARYSQSKSLVSLAYESGIHSDDIRARERRYWEEKSYDLVKVNHYYKYIGNDIGNSAANTVPLLRLSEMYLILIENTPLGEANEYFKTYRISRSMGSLVDDSLVDDESVRERLEKEYRKEFFGEGQMFFFYKRLGYEKFTWPGDFTVPEGAYVIPIPKSQASFE